MNELDIEVMKEKYIEYKEKHYEDELEIRKLIKVKKLVPSVETDSEWKKDYEKLNDNLADELYYYNELKKMLPEEEFADFVDKVKYNIIRQRYIKFRLDKFDEKEEFADIFNDIEKVIPKVENLDKSSFAKDILDENELIDKIKVICKYRNNSINVFFDTTAILKAEIVRIFIDNNNITNVDKNKLITACLVYAFKRTNTPKEIERIKKEKEKEREFLKSLGFDDNFCKICSEYNRYNEIEGYNRENEGDILELVDNFVGLIMHREDRTAFPVDEALDILEFKNLSNYNNKYINKFKSFIKSLEEIEISRFIGIVTYFANCVNNNQRSDISSIIKTIMEVRELIGGPVSIENILKLEKIEKIQDKYSIIQYLEQNIDKTKDKISSLSKILRGYKSLPNNNKNE